MKKPKIKMDSAAIQTFFLHHIEKILFGAVLLLMGLLVYQGLGQTGLEDGKNPDALMKLGNDALTFINQPGRWAKLAEQREPQYSVNIREEVEQGQAPTDAGHYFLPKPLAKPDFAKQEPRKDPELYAPMHVIVVPMFGPLAEIAKPGEVDPLYEVAPEDEGDTRPKAKARPKRNRRPSPGGMYSGVPGMSGMPGEEMYDSGAESPPPGRRAARGKRGRGGSSQASEMTYPSGMPESPMAGNPYGGSYSMDGSYGSGMGGAGGKLYPEATEYGYNSNNPMAIARPAKAMVIMALVPYEKQWEEYERVFAESLNYDPKRDIPHYEHIRIERADVTDIPDETDPAVLEPLFAKTRLNVNAMVATQIGTPPTPANPRGVPGAWAGMPPELADPLYLHPKLTYPAPPFMQRDLWDVLVHPEVPVASARAREAASRTPETPTTPDATAIEDMPGVFNRGMGGGMGSGMGSSMGSSYDPSGMGGSYGGAMGGSYGMSGMPGYGGYSGMPGSYGSGSTSYALPKYKLIRFTDTTIEEGRKYRYRVKVLLHDSNNPRQPNPDPRVASAGQTFTAPTPASLDPTVQARLKETKAANPNQWWVESPWSEISDVATLPPTSRFYAGKVEPPSVIRLPAGEVATGQPEANALTVVWDEIKVVDVPVEVKVQRGTVLNLKNDVEVIHPVTKELMPLKEYQFSTDAVVADVQGGEEIPRLDGSRAAEDEIAAPGELLVFDAQGRLHIQNEVEDIEMFRRFLPKPESEQPQQGGYDPYAAGGGMDASYDPLSADAGYPTGPPARGRRGR